MIMIACDRCPTQTPSVFSSASPSSRPHRSRIFVASGYLNSSTTNPTHPLSWSAPSATFARIWSLCRTWRSKAFRQCRARRFKSCAPRWERSSTWSAQRSHKMASRPCLTRRCGLAWLRRREQEPVMDSSAVSSRDGS